MTTTTMASDRQLQLQLCAMVTKATGIQLPANKATMVEGRLRKRVRATGKTDIKTYLKAVMEDGLLESELPHIINVLTTNKTDFFREAAHFRYLVQNVLPSQPTSRTYKVWSAASSSGEEAYTTAMVLAEFAKSASGFKYSILGTDLSTTVVSKARKGVYTMDEIVDVPQDMQDKYLEMGHSSDGKKLARVVKTLRDNVSFANMNLMARSYPVDKQMDLVLLRNVLIYFDEPTQHRVVSTITDHLRLGGFLFVGHSESGVATDPRLKQLAAAVFRKETM